MGLMDFLREFELPDSLEAVEWLDAYNMPEDRFGIKSKEGLAIVSVLGLRE
jgi:hypothetical protein